MNAEGLCWFAHALKELQPPSENQRQYDDVWRDGVHRWYGQHMPKEVIDRISEYYVKTNVCDTPMWAHALRWYDQRADDREYDMMPADFGLEQDFEVVRIRRGGRRPFA